MPCRNSSTNPIKTKDFAGHCGSPPAFIDCSLIRYDRMKKGIEVIIKTMVSGRRKKRWPMRSMTSRHRFGSMLFTISMRMCSFERSVQGEQSRNITPNSTHCSSSQAFEEVSKSFRTVALVAEIRTTTKISQAMLLPMR